MARVCGVCGKHPRVANLVSHANNRVKRWVYPNVQRMRFTLAKSTEATVRTANVCMKCVKAGKVKKVF